MTQEPTLTFTGERVVPGQVEPDLYAEHMTRYQYAALFSAGRRVLDAGCGAGYGTEYLAANASAVIGIDNSVEAIRFARAQYTAPHLNFFVAACESLPFLDRSFDLIVTFEVIEHLADPAGYLRELARVLAPTGQLILSTPNKRQYSDALPDYENPYHLHEFYSAEWRQLLSEVFPSVQHLAQNYAQGLSFRPVIAAEGQAQQVQIERAKVQEVQERHEQIVEETQFFVAVCSHSQAASPTPERLYLFSESNILAEKDRWIRALSAQVTAATTEVEGANTIIQGLQESLSEQSTWAQRSAQIVVERDEQIQQLSEQIQQLSEQVRVYEQQFGQRLRRQIAKIPTRIKKR